MMFGGRHMRGVLSQEQAKPMATGKTIRRLLTYFEPFWSLLALVAALGCALPDWRCCGSVYRAW